MKKLFSTPLLLLFLCGTSAAVDNDMLSKYRSLPEQQLFDTATWYYNKNHLDTALICYNLLLNTPIRDNDVEQQRLIIKAFNSTATLYYLVCDYRKSYELLLRALDLCEHYQHHSDKIRLYANIGNIYYRFNKYDMAKYYYLMGLNLKPDSTIQMLILNNLGHVALENGNLDSAFHFLHRSLEGRTQNDIHLFAVQHSLALCYQKAGQYDSAYRYYRLSLTEAQKTGKVEAMAYNLSDLGKLFFEISKTDSAVHYINLANTVAEKNSYLRILADNHLTLSKIKESEGRSKSALVYFKKYVGLKDSLFNIDQFGEINQLQHLYEVSKTNRQIQQLATEQQIKERTIRYQNIILSITIGILLLVSMMLLFVYFQNQKLNRSYKVLVQKNMEIMALQENIPKEYAVKYQKSALSEDMGQELLDKILAVMEDTAVICDPKFSIDKLAELAQSNRTYTSQVINTALSKNFRSFLNTYRIREAQRLLLDPETTKYTIESIALRAGFKSQSAFYDAFKEITGVSPNFYLKSMREQQQNHG